MVHRNWHCLSMDSPVNQVPQTEGDVDATKQSETKLDEDDDDIEFKLTPEVDDITKGTTLKIRRELTTYYKGGFKNRDFMVYLKAINLVKTGFSETVKAHLRSMMRQKFAENHEFCKSVNSPFINQLIYPIHQLDIRLMASRYCTHENILAWLHTSADMHLHHVCVALQHVCKALRYLHKRHHYHGNVGFTNILFPDIKPESVKLSMDSSLGYELFRLCSTTPIQLPFCPPELIQPIIDANRRANHKQGKCRSVDELAAINAIIAPTAQADMWSLGVVFHALITGKFPFNCGSLSDQLDAIQNQSRSTRNEDFFIYSEPLREQVDRFLLADPKRRIKAKSAAHGGWVNCEEIRRDDRCLVSRYEVGYFWMEKLLNRDRQRLLDCMTTFREQ